MEASTSQPEKNDKTNLESFLEDLHLDQFYTKKLSLNKVLQIDEKTIDDGPAKSKSDLPWLFLKKLMMVNAMARNVKIIPESKNDVSRPAVLDLENLMSSSTSTDVLHPLDIITALFLCSDGFVQQELAFKMSMCQFSVPLLLPDCDKNQSTLMLWALRDIVKKYRPKSLFETKGFIENSIVLSELPMISFVRLGECSLSKSGILNKLLSSSQLYHDIFVHHNMDCGDSPRRISNGLVEITWFLPCGNENIDTFSQPVAFANLRGDMILFEKQFSFLCQTSAAVFVFFDNLDPECKLLRNQHSECEIFLVGNPQSRSFDPNALKQVASAMSLTNANIILKTKTMNDAHFVIRLREAATCVVEKTKVKMKLEKMAENARELGIMVDEDAPENKAGKEMADAITAEIHEILKYKKDQLPLQGELWKELTFLDKEQVRLQKVGSENIENYKSKLELRRDELRRKQNSCDMTKAMTSFIMSISSDTLERDFFLKWLRINLDNMSRIKLSGLREQYKEKTKNSENKKEIKDIDQQVSNSSLGTEHFFREMGQIYEASQNVPEKRQFHEQFNHLPKLCAQLLLDGFPLELIDGDASNIPLKWMSSVLTELNHLVCPKNKILVVTVLGVQSTGKSTLLNTMFGVQFAVSSGRCTRGAFMLLIRIDEDFKKKLNCDFMMIIDTEGLKSPELTQLDNSYEHDNELATLVVGLSDITIINIAMENSTEMKDILQIVVHAFLRMKEVGKKPKCYFVHQNVPDVSAHDKNLRDRELLFQQLNEMTQVAAKMERREENQSFSDVMEYDPDTGNCYVPGLWTGNPPMAAVNTGYSETAYDLKKNIIQLLERTGQRVNNVMEFKEWMTSLWQAVKHEKFLFSFRNSLVADAYMTLCAEFNRWEWEFKKEMYNWVRNAETKISNFGIVKTQLQTSDLKNYHSQLKTEAITVISKWEIKLLDNVTKYFEQTDGHVYLVVGYQEEFANSVKMLQKKTERSVLSDLQAAVDIKQGMAVVEHMKENHRKEIEEAVLVLIRQCRGKEVEVSDDELDEEFDKMWNEKLNTLSFSELQPENIFDKISRCLWDNVAHSGSHAIETLGTKRLEECGKGDFKYDAQVPWKKMHKYFQISGNAKVLKQLADNIIKTCTHYVADKISTRNNYHDTYIQEILRIIDQDLERNQHLKTNPEFEVSLKQHICGFAAREFQKMHKDFLQENNPRTCLLKDKGTFCADFKDVFHKRDQCQKKAQEFVDKYLKPAVGHYITRNLGVSVVDDMKKFTEFSTRAAFQYHILLDLLSKKDFDDYLRFTTSYDSFVKEWILRKIMECFSNTSKMCDFETQHLKSSVGHINDAIKKAKTLRTGSVKAFVETLCKELGDTLVISQDALGSFLILNNADEDKFGECLDISVNDMEETLAKQFKTSTFKNKLQCLHPQPQKELFDSVIGCGQQCPFCGVACESGGEAHTKHQASLHRPQGLGQYRWSDTEKLVTDMCSSLVASNISFRCSKTNMEPHPYKEYRQIFPNWDIFPDTSLEASDYWKYIVTKYNNDFAEAHNAEPADIPEAWKRVNEEQARDSLQKSFNVK